MHVATCENGPLAALMRASGPLLLRLMVHQLVAPLRVDLRFLSAEDLPDRVRDEDADPFTNTVTVTIGRLCRKLAEPPAILTTPRAGYRTAHPEDR